MSILSGDPFEMPESSRRIEIQTRGHRELVAQDWRTLMPVTRPGELPFGANPAPVVTIRLATPIDTAALVGMATHFIEDSPYRAFVGVSHEQLEILIAYLLEHGAIHVAAVESGGLLVGMLGASIVPHICDGVLVATEVAWWVEPKFRGARTWRRLLAASEAWAREHGARRFQMIAPVGSALPGIYRRLGYSEVETLFQRELH